VKASQTMQQFVEQIFERHGVGQSKLDMYLRLDLPGYDSLVIDALGRSQIAVINCFEEASCWKIDREVVFFIDCQAQWIPVEITQQATGWTAFARVSSDGQCIVRLNRCGQEQLAEFTERWARKLMRQDWVTLGIPYKPWVPPSRKGVGQ